jgi:hypothetical protein
VPYFSVKGMCDMCMHVLTRESLKYTGTWCRVSECSVHKHSVVYGILLHTTTGRAHVSAVPGQNGHGGHITVVNVIVAKWMFASQQMTVLEQQ